MAFPAASVQRRHAAGAGSVLENGIKVFGCRLFSKRQRSLKLFEKSFTKNFSMICGICRDQAFSAVSL
ncbi:hypothetical protein [Komagataeibacter xylinus]|uniref:hypothetical protein n=1 Tax=Komagataeibacter xylinus TaxID=28448 RepID=UPI0013EECC2B|nr:hypothetical protein [Komagataeibacter xylinus]